MESVKKVCFIIQKIKLSIIYAIFRVMRVCCHFIHYVIKVSERVIHNFCY